MPPRLLRPVTLFAAAVALLTAGCGGDEESGRAGSEELSDAAAEARATLEDTSVKPVIEKPTGSPPRRLVKEDIVKGGGSPASPGDRITVHYVGVSFSTGREFDASWNTGRPFSFPLGAGQVIPGWDQGIVGMKRGGRRKLTIPPELAYGAEGAPPDIAPNETLVFVVDLVKINPRS